jgi:hypothetical protein
MTTFDFEDDLDAIEAAVDRADLADPSEEAMARAVALADSLASDPAFGRDPDLIAAEVVRQMPELRR